MQIFGWVISWYKKDLYWNLVELRMLEGEIAQCVLLLDKEESNPVPDSILKHEVRRSLRIALAKYRVFLRENKEILSTDVPHFEGDVRRILVTKFARRPE